MDQKPVNQLPQQTPTARFAIPSLQSTSVGSLPGTQLSQQPQPVMASVSLQSPPQSIVKAPTPGYPTTTTPTHSLSIKTEPGVTPPVVDASVLTGTTIKEELVPNPALDVDQKPELNPGDVVNTLAPELIDGDVKPDPSLQTPKPPVAKKGLHLSHVDIKGGSTVRPQ